MNPNLTLIVVLLLAAGAFHLGRTRALRLESGTARGASTLHSLPGYYGWYVALWCGVPAFCLYALWIVFEPTITTYLVVQGLPQEMRDLPATRLSLLVNDIRNTVNGNIASSSDLSITTAADHYQQLRTLSHMALAVTVVCLAMVGAAHALRAIGPEFRARNSVEAALKVFLIASSTLAIFTTLGIIMSVLFEAIRFFNEIPPLDFLFGLEWSPQTAIRADQVGASGAFGSIPLLAGTMLISAIAMLVAAPIGLLSAIYLAEYASAGLRGFAKPALEILAGIPTVVYGFFAALTVAPLLRNCGASIGLDVSSESALAAGGVMGLMLIPFVSSLSDDVINAVPQNLRDGSYALGATRSETILQVIIPAALPGIVGALLLAVSRAIGETMIVVMAAGLAANLTANPLEAVTTVTVQIVTLLVGDQEFDSAKTLAAFALGLLLFAITLVLNVIALHLVKKYREQYD
ncbi:MAG: phosphate transport system permease protein [Gammaproteobacteria bacterium]|jgi:phosphate transport system permease protein